MLFKKIAESIMVVVGITLGSNYEFLRSKVIEDVNRENKRIYGSEDYNMLDIKLTTNFRCSSKITSFANDIIKSFKIIQQNKMQSYEDQEGYNNEKSVINPTLISYKSNQEQFESILSQILTSIIQGYRFEDIAIICPTGSLLRDFEYKLEKHNRFFKNQISFWSFLGKNNDYGFKYEYKAEKITQLTIHKSKGLQWKILFFVGLNDDLFPKAFLKQKNNENRQIEEMWRLFYVGSTRAAKILNLSYFSYFQKLACRFLSKINKEHIAFKGDVAIVDEKRCEQSDYSNYKSSNYQGKQISELFDEMSNTQHLEELEFSQQKYLSEKYFELEKEQKVHEKMFSKQQIQYFFYHQSVELLFAYLETVILWILQKKVKIDNRSVILNEQSIQKQQLLQNSKKLQIQDQLIQSFIDAMKLFQTTDQRISQIEENIESIFKVSILQDIVKSDFDPNRIFEYFTVSSQNTLYEICQSFKKTKKIEKQVMLTVLAKISLLKKKHGKDIKKIKFYNPIKGTVFTVLVKDWEFHQDFIDFILKFNQNLQNPQQSD
ncbi:hypothetical protein ABPG72_007236 [Tetrahymena utriculariae]